MIRQRLDARGDVHPRPAHHFALLRQFPEIMPMGVIRPPPAGLILVRLGANAFWISDRAPQPRPAAWRTRPGTVAGVLISVPDISEKFAQRRGGGVLRGNSSASASLRWESAL